MILNINNKKFIFVHIPKCGGTSISHCMSTGNNEFYKYNGFRHNTLEQDIEFCNIQKNSLNINETFVFSSVRNPWDRIVSVYHFHRILKENKYPWVEFCKKHSFLDFIKYSEENHKKMIVFTTYMEFLSQNNEFCVDYIIDFNNINNDFKFISNLFDVTAALPKVNKTNHKEYKFYYNSYSEEVIRNHFINDIKFFQFCFEDPKEFKKSNVNYNKIQKLFPDKLQKHRML